MLFEPIDASVEGVVDLLSEADAVRRHRHELVTRLHFRRVRQQKLARMIFRSRKEVGDLGGSLGDKIQMIVGKEIVAPFMASIILRIIRYIDIVFEQP